MEGAYYTVAGRAVGGISCRDKWVAGLRCGEPARQHRGTGKRLVVAGASRSQGRGGPLRSLRPIQRIGVFRGQADSARRGSCRGDTAGFVLPSLANSRAVGRGTWFTGGVGVGGGGAPVGVLGGGAAGVERRDRRAQC